MVRNILLHIVFLLIPFIGMLQEPFVSLEVSSKTIEVGQVFSITIKTNVDGDINIDLPNEFIPSGGSQTGMSSSIEVVDGKRRAVNYKFRTFAGYLEKKGDYNFGPATVKARNGESFRSEVQKIKALKSQNMISSNPSENMSEKVFGLIQQSKKEIYEGESLVILSKVYSQVPVIQFEEYTSYGFDKPAETQAIGPERIRTGYEVVNGKNITTFEISKHVVFPEQVGQYEIQPYHITVLTDDPRSFFPERKSVLSNRSEIKVKPLPSGMPSYFIDGVGKFSLSGKLKKTEVLQGEVVELKLKVSGNGNLHNIKKPNVKLPEGLTFYGDPEVQDSFSYCNLGVVGSKTFTYYIQVNKAGDIKIDPVKAAYFDLESETYKTLTFNFKPIHSLSSEDVLLETYEAHLGEESVIAMQPYLTNNNSDISVPSSLFEGWGGVALLSPLMLGAILGIVVRKRNQKEEDKNKLKSESLYKTTALAEVENLDSISDNNEKVIALSKTLTAFLASHFDVEKGTISRSFLNSMAPDTISEDDCQRLISIFNELDAMKYGVDLAQSDIDHLKEEVNTVINTLTK